MAIPIVSREIAAMQVLAVLRPEVESVADIRVLEDLADRWEQALEVVVLPEAWAKVEWAKVEWAKAAWAKAFVVDLDEVDLAEVADLVAVALVANVECLVETVAAA